MPKWGGGGVSCTICSKTVYPAETIQFEKRAYHVECFKCNTCAKKMEGAAQASEFEGIIYCRHCFQKGGFNQKQRNTQWTKKEGTASSASSKFGGGGTPCKICAKTVYAAETVAYEKQSYHADCFCCSKCSKKMTPSSAASFEDNLFCSKCFKEGGYTRKQAAARGGGTGKASAISKKFGGGGNPCTVCEKTVYSAETVAYEKKAYHADCFKCSECSKKMTPSGAAQFEGTLFCTKCFQAGGYTRKQAATAKSGGGGGGSSKFAGKFGGGGSKCYRCEKTVYPAETVPFEKQVFHADCFTCLTCNIKLTPSKAEGKKKENGVDVYCSKCWAEGGHNRAKIDAPKEEAAAEAPAEE